MASQLTQPVAVADPALAALAAHPVDQPVLLLHSGRFDPRWATRSLLAAPAGWFRYTADHHSQLIDLPQPTHPLTHNLWHDLRALLNDPALPGRWIGYFSYDLAPLIEPHKLRPNPAADAPLVELAYCPTITEFPAPHLPPKPAPERSEGPDRVPDLRSTLPRNEYESAVRRALDYIAAGDIFQVNLAQRFTTPLTTNPRDLYQKLATVSPAWFGAHLELPRLATPLAACSSSSSNDSPPDPSPRCLLSTSPELFLRVTDRHVITRPIKGTRPDSRAELARSEKDTAELNMIVDLMRNDLGRVCTYGSIRVTQPRTIESHPTIHHAAATIEGDLHPRKDIVDLLRATLPGGSITGAPKVRAMQIINELEPTPRGPYCGCIGLISQNELHLNIAIRTLELTPAASNNPHQYEATFSAGAGIVADSNPAAEYEETLAKAAAILRALTP